MKSQLRTLLVLAATIVLLVIIYFAYQGLLPHSKCDSIFQQASDQLRTNVDFVKNNGELILGPETVQELTEGSQKVALHLKTCCIAAEDHIINAEQFEDCISGAKDYEDKVVQVATSVKEAQAAKKQQNPELAKQKEQQASKQAIEASEKATSWIAKHAGLFNAPRPK